MTASELPSIASQRRHLGATIDRLGTLAAQDPATQLTDGDRADVDHAIIGALQLLSDDAHMQSALTRFAPGPDRRPARVSDILVTLNLLDQALQA